MCQADSGRRVIPTSPEVESFQCGECRHEWSEPAVTVSVGASGRESMSARILRPFGLT